ncbi:MAG: PilZ domain-containing protein [Lysobacterales bacterium]
MLNQKPSAEDAPLTGHVILDRRQEPRFELPGRFRRLAADAPSGRVVDLSLNGALLECDGAVSCKAGDVLEILLELDESRPFAAQVRIAHVQGARLGVEFHEIEPQAFEMLSDLVLALRRAPALAKISIGS